MLQEYRGWNDQLLTFDLSSHRWSTCTCLVSNIGKPVSQGLFTRNVTVSLKITVKDEHCANNGRQFDGKMGCTLILPIKVSIKGTAHKNGDLNGTCK